MTEITGPDWKLDIPREWEEHEEDDTLIVYDPDGVGALQISGMATDGEVSDEDLRELAREHIEAGAKTRPVEFGDFTGFTFDYSEEDEFWQEWYLRSGHVSLYATYNCELDDKGVESELIEQVLSTLQRS